MNKRILRGLLGSATGMGDEPLALRGTVTSKTGLSVLEFPGLPVRHTRLYFSNMSVATVDNTTNGANGSQPLYVFPAGTIQIVGSNIKATIARVGTGLGATAAVVAALGTVAAAADAALTSTEADIIASIAATLASGAGVVAGVGSTVQLATGKTVRLNFAVPDAGTTTNDALLVNGYVDLFWIQLSDS